jgi:hypothetical protein
MPRAMPTGISIVALAVSALALLVAFASYRRDRPKLELSLGYGGDEEGLYLEVTVVNDGRHPVALAQLSIGFGPPSAPEKAPRIVRRSRFVLLRLLMKLPGCPKWLQRLLSEKPDESSLQSGIPLTGVVHRGLPQPILLAPGEPRTFRFKRTELDWLEAPVLYVAAMDALGRVVRMRVPSDAHHLLFGPRR